MINQDSQYDILINTPVETLEARLEHTDASAFFIIVDNNTHEHCWPVVSPAFRKLRHYLVVLPPGEMFKSLVSCREIWDKFVDKHADRSSMVINLGGGVICDMGGFAASVFMRGMRFVHMPTSLLSQVDAAIGGKVGVDYQTYKNILGSFAFPQWVWVHTPFLKTLDRRQLRSGFAEVIKHALLTGADHWNTVQAISDLDQITDWSEIISKSIHTKSSIAHSDPMEAGPRKLLNLGHSIGHALESASLKSGQPLLHGEAISQGLISASYISYKKKLLTRNKYVQIQNFINHHFSDVDLSHLDFDQVRRNLSYDKKNKMGRKMFVLLEDFGQAVIDQEVEEVLIEEALAVIR